MAQFVLDASALLALIQVESGADRICLATAQVHGGTVLTTEQAWRKVRLEHVMIEVVRSPGPARPLGQKEH